MNDDQMERFAQYERDYWYSESEKQYDLRENYRVEDEEAAYERNYQFKHDDL